MTCGPDLAQADRLTQCTAVRAGGTDLRPLMRLSLASTRDEAIALQGRELLACGGELDDVPHYAVGQLIGAEVRSHGGVTFGTVAAVLQAPAHELLEITSPSGAPLLVPLVDELVTFDVDARLVRIPDGLLDGEPGD